MSTYLLLTVYADPDPLNKSDQITVPTVVWEQFDRDHTGNGPIFVAVGSSDSGLVGRLRPAVPEDALVDACAVPSWMWIRLGAPTGGDDDCWIGLTVCPLPIAGSLTLRAHHEATLTGAADPVAMLTEELSRSWASLSTGAELPLVCGTFDIVEIRSIEGFPVPAACVLDCDVDLEIAEARDHVSPCPSPCPCPCPSPSPETPVPAKGFVPFSGKGHRLG